MGRFDALTQMEEQPEKQPPVPEVPSPHANISHIQNTNKATEQEKKPASPKTRKPAKQSPPLDLLDIPEKYTTRLEPSLVKKIRLHAIEKDMNDYEVVRRALNQYFESNT